MEDIMTCPYCSPSNVKPLSPDSSNFSGGLGIHSDGDLFSRVGAPDIYSCCTSATLLSSSFTWIHRQIIRQIQIYNHAALQLLYSPAHLPGQKDRYISMLHFSYFTLQLIYLDTQIHNQIDIDIQSCCTSATLLSSSFTWIDRQIIRQIQICNHAALQLLYSPAHFPGQIYR